jgi:uncharacterized protein
MRQDEDYDLEHDKRASEFVKMLNKKNLIRISPRQLKQLTFACRHHNDPRAKSSDLTIQTCWDNDRLDIGRTGIVVDKKYLNSNVAKLSCSTDFVTKLKQNEIR